MENRIHPTYGKIRRPTASDYINAAMVLDTNQIPSFHDFMEDLKIQWQEQFTIAERQGAGGKAPITFADYLALSMETLKKQVEEVIPVKFREGLITKEDAAAATELANILLRYEDRAFREATNA
jgi:hypothetical protein